MNTSQQKRQKSFKAVRDWHPSDLCTDCPSHLVVGELKTLLLGHSETVVFNLCPTCIFRHSPEMPFDFILSTAVPFYTYMTPESGSAGGLFC